MNLRHDSVWFRRPSCLSGSQTLDAERTLRWFHEYGTGQQDDAASPNGQRHAFAEVVGQNERMTGVLVLVFAALATPPLPPRLLVPFRITTRLHFLHPPLPLPRYTPLPPPPTSRSAVAISRSSRYYFVTARAGLPTYARDHGVPAFGRWRTTCCWTRYVATPRLRSTRAWQVVRPLRFAVSAARGLPVGTAAHHNHVRITISSSSPSSSQDLLLLRPHTNHHYCLLPLPGAYRTPLNGPPFVHRYHAFLFDRTTHLFVGRAVCTEPPALPLRRGHWFSHAPRVYRQQHTTTAPVGFYFSYAFALSVCANKFILHMEDAVCAHEDHSPRSLGDAFARFSTMRFANRYAVLGSTIP